MFKPDQPIQSHKEDILGRKTFAQSLGNAILNYKEKDSIVIGLFGAWGSGKTSIINMALEHINSVYDDKTDGTKSIIMKFNPWNYSDQNQLISQFFKQLSVILKRADYASNAKKAGEKLETYAKFFEPFALIPKVGPVATIISKVVKNIGGAAKSWGSLKSSDLDSIRTELNNLLAEQSHKIVVIIDDIDRLNNTEIRQVFQLIKSLGDFPNTIYLLAFDKNVVINALQKVQEGSGSEYLEKIVQVPFDIPLISKQEVEDLLFNQLTELIKDVPKRKWDQTYWEHFFYYSGLRYFFDNIRDVIRYINLLRFSFSIIKDEVNVVDFFVLTAIQVFMPEVYDGIKDNKDIFSGVHDSNYEKGKAVIEQAKKRCDEIISRTNELHQEKLKEILTNLFPKLESIYGSLGYHYGSRRDWRSDGRVCSPDIFDIFFQLSVPKSEISQKEIEAILSLAGNPNAFAEALLKLNEDGRIVRFLERLEDYTQKDISEENIEPVITVLMDIGDLFPEVNLSFWDSVILPDIIHGLTHQLLRRFNSDGKRLFILKNAIKKTTNSLHTIVYEVHKQEQKYKKDESKENPELKEKPEVNAILLELEKLTCDKIESWASDGRLLKHNRLDFILFNWKKWGKQEQIDRFVSHSIKDDDGLIDFIKGFLSKSKDPERIRWRIYLNYIKEFVDLKQIEPRIRNIFSSSKFKQLDDNDKRKLAIKIFLDTFDGKMEDRF